MEIIGVKTPLIRQGDNIIDVLFNALEKQGLDIEHHDILVVSGKILAIGENRVIKLSTVSPSPYAKEIADKYQITPELAELIIQESDTILGGIPTLVLTLRENVLLANAGIDKSNTPEGWVSLLPSNSFDYANHLRQAVKERFAAEIGVIVADSRSQPLRHGLIGVALGVAGIEPLIDERGHEDLYGRRLRITRRAVADDLASAAQIIMGESNESIPFVIVRDAPVSFTDRRINPQDFTISPDTCLYFTIFREWAKRNRLNTKK
ncbi:MAG: coenzyme F420-0:L-glutamate ligase [Candidatus Ranarchaeia archaeon]